MREWILNFELKDDKGHTLKFVTGEQELTTLEKTIKKEVSTAKRDAWSAFVNEIKSYKTRSKELKWRVTKWISSKNTPRAQVTKQIMIIICSS